MSEHTIVAYLRWSARQLGGKRALARHLKVSRTALEYGLKGKPGEELLRAIGWIVEYRPARRANGRRG